MNEEANAIGTSWLRARLPPDSLRTEMQSRPRQHIALRVRAGGIGLAHEPDRDIVLGEANRNPDSIWGLAVRPAAEDPDKVASGLFIRALNDMIDPYARGDASLAHNVPNGILFLLFATFVLTGSVAGHRPSRTTYALAVLIVVLSFVILDLDRPRSGMNRIDRSNLINLGRAVAAERDIVGDASRAVTVCADMRLEP